MTRPAWYSAVLMLTVLAIAPTQSISAQAAPDRLALQLWRDSLSRIGDTLTLQRLGRTALELARAGRDNPILHLRRGFVMLRLVELQGRGDFDDAAFEFEWAAELRPDWPYPWLGLGLAEARAPDRAGGFAGGLWTMLGVDRDRLAGDAFARSVHIDPTFVEGLVSFAETARNQRIGAPLRPALNALRAATTAMEGWHPALLLERGRLERMVGDPELARVAFSRAVLLSHDPAVAWVELARTLPMTADTSAASPGEPTPTEVAYYNAAISDNPESVAMLRRDLEPIVADSILRTFDAQHGESRVAWLKQFWQGRGAVDLRSPVSRLVEHLRRWVVARREFQLPPFKRRYRWGFELFHSGDAELDDRGIVWLRHGEPTARIIWPRSRPAMRPDPLQRNSGNESWRYARPEGDLVLHFVATDDEDDYRLVEDALDLDVALDQLQQRAGEVPGLARLLRAGPNSVPWVSDEERLRGRRSIAVATQSDSWERQYRAPLLGRAQWLAAGVRGGQPLVHLVYAVDAASLRSLPGSGLIPLTVRAVFLDAMGRSTASLDTVQYLQRPGPDARFVAVRAEVIVPAGRQKIRLGVESSDALGAVYPVDSIVVPSVAGTSFEGSALLVGLAARSLVWHATPTDTAWLDALGVFAPSDTLTVYAELYGVPVAAPASVRLTIKRQRSRLGRLFSGGTGTITVSEQIAVSASPFHWRRSVGLGGLAPGNYLLEFSAETDGKWVVRRRGLTVVDRKLDHP